MATTLRLALLLASVAAFIVFMVGVFGDLPIGALLGRIATVFGIFFVMGAVIGLLVSRKIEGELGPRAAEADTGKTAKDKKPA